MIIPKTESIKDQILSNTFRPVHLYNPYNRTSDMHHIKQNFFFRYHDAFFGNFQVRAEVTRPHIYPICKLLNIPVFIKHFYKPHFEMSLVSQERSHLLLPTLSTQSLNL